MRSIYVDGNPVDLIKVQQMLIGNFSDLQIDMCGIIDRSVPAQRYTVYSDEARRCSGRCLTGEGTNGWINEKKKKTEQTNELMDFCVVALYIQMGGTGQGVGTLESVEHHFYRMFRCSMLLSLNVRIDDGTVFMINAFPTPPFCLS